MSLMGKQREEHFPSTNGENMWTSEKSGLVIASEDGRCCRKKIHLQVCLLAGIVGMLLVRKRREERSLQHGCPSSSTSLIVTVKAKSGKRCRKNTRNKDRVARIVFTMA